jgi:beta-glucosidase
VDVLASATVTLAGDELLPALTLDSSVEEWLGHPVVGAELVEGFAVWLPDLPPPSTEAGLGMLRMVGSMPMRRFVADLGASVPAGELDRLVARAAAARAERVARA